MTKDILHAFQIDTKPERVAEALLDPAQIADWWTREVETQDDQIVLGWSGHGFEVAIRPEFHAQAQCIVWHCTRSNMLQTDAWVGSTVVFQLSPLDGGTHIDFAHTGYKDSPCYDECVVGWAYFVGTSLKQYLETGVGTPYPVVVDPSKL